MNMTLRRFTCLRCGHNWLPRIEGRPVQCPRCKSIAWDTERPEGERTPDGAA